MQDMCRVSVQGVPDGGARVVSRSSAPSDGPGPSFRRPGPRDEFSWARLTRCNQTSPLRCSVDATSDTGGSSSAPRGPGPLPRTPSALAPAPATGPWSSGSGWWSAARSSPACTPPPSTDPCVAWCTRSLSSRCETPRLDSAPARCSQLFGLPLQKIGTSLVGVPVSWLAKCGYYFLVINLSTHLFRSLNYKILQRTVLSSTPAYFVMALSAPYRGGKCERTAACGRTCTWCSLQHVCSLAASEQRIYGRVLPWLTGDTDSVPHVT